MQSSMRLQSTSLTSWSTSTSPPPRSPSQASFDVTQTSNCFEDPFDYVTSITALPLFSIHTPQQQSGELLFVTKVKPAPDSDGMDVGAAPSYSAADRGSVEVYILPYSSSSSSNLVKVPYSASSECRCEIISTLSTVTHLYPPAALSSLLPSYPSLSNAGCTPPPSASPTPFMYPVSSLLACTPFSQLLSLTVYESSSPPCSLTFTLTPVVVPFSYPPNPYNYAVHFPNAPAPGSDPPADYGGCAAVGRGGSIAALSLHRNASTGSGMGCVVGFVDINAVAAAARAPLPLAVAAMPQPQPQPAPILGLYDSVHSDTVVHLKFRDSFVGGAATSAVLLSSGLDGLTAVYDASLPSESEALQCVLNAGGSASACGFFGPIQAASGGPTGVWILSGPCGEKLTLWDYASGQLLWKYPLNFGDMRRSPALAQAFGWVAQPGSAAEGPDLDYFISCEWHDAHNGAPPFREAEGGVAPSSGSDGSLILLAGSLTGDVSLLVVNVDATGTCRLAPAAGGGGGAPEFKAELKGGHRATVRAATRAVGRNRDTLITGGEDGRLCVWTGASGGAGEGGKKSPQPGRMSGGGKSDKGKRMTDGKEYKK